MLKYELVKLEEKKAVGYTARTSNAAPDMEQVIGGLWNKLYSSEGVATIQNRVNAKALETYSDYATDVNGEYTVGALVEVSNIENVPADMDILTIPAGTYAKFVVEGNVVTAVQEFWSEFWKMDLPRKYGVDFEEYQNEDMEHAIIYIYISME